MARVAGRRTSTSVRTIVATGTRDFLLSIRAIKPGLTPFRMNCAFRTVRTIWTRKRGSRSINWTVTTFRTFGTVSYHFPTNFLPERTCWTRLSFSHANVAIMANWTGILEIVRSPLTKKYIQSKYKECRSNNQKKTIA